MRKIEGKDNMDGGAILVIKNVKRPYGRLCVSKVYLASSDWLSHASEVCVSDVCSLNEIIIQESSYVKREVLNYGFCRLWRAIQ